MTDYTFTMNHDLGDVTMTQFTKICTFLNGQFGSTEDESFTLNKASAKPSLKSVNTAFAKEGLSYTCVSVT